jgi:hypothetical protein
MLASVTGAQAFNSEGALLSHYEAINDTGRSVRAVVFEDFLPNGDPPDHLKYKIRISNRNFYTADLFPVFSVVPPYFGKNGKIFNKYVI